MSDVINVGQKMLIAVCKNMTKLTYSVILLLISVLAGCSTHFTTLQGENKKYSVIHQLPEEQAFQMAYWAITSSFPDRKITDVNEGSIMGYSTYTRSSLLETYSQQVLVFPAIGTTKKGDEIKGYYFEISGSGTSDIGQQKNVKMYEKLNKALADTGTGAVVTNVRASKYESGKHLSIDGNQRHSQEANPRSPADVLRELSQLHKDGIVSDAEFEVKKKELLQRM